MECNALYSRLILQLLKDSYHMSFEADSSQQTEAIYNSALKPKKDDHLNSKLRVSLKKNARSKLQFDDNQSRITEYFAKSNAKLLSRQTANESSTILQATIEMQRTELEKKLNLKEEQLKHLKSKQEENQLRLKKKEEEQKELFKKIAESMLVQQEHHRNYKAKIDVNLGYYLDDCRTFVEGESIVSLKKEIQKNTDLLYQLEQKKKLKEPNTHELLLIQGSCEFILKEVNQQKQELEVREKQLQAYKQRLLFAAKERKSLYAIQKWPIIYGCYQTLSLLGSGGFGQVYKCYDLKTNRKVAIKRVTFNSKANESYKDEFYRHVEREAEIQQTLNHPNIARLQRVIEINRSKNCAVFELEYCSGPQLSKYIKKYKTIAEKQAKIIIKQVFCALAYLGSLKQKIIHYDLKPSNIMFQDGVIKILDFGLCKIMNESEDTRIELTSQGVGTYYYLPPQTFDQYDPKISPKVDVWSAGIIFYQMLFGKRPFGQGMSQVQIMKNATILQARKVQFPQDLVKKLKISEGAKEFIAGCLKYQADERLSPSQALEHPYLKKLN